MDNFKAYTNITRSELAAAIDAAHRRGMKVTGHLCSIGFREAAVLGIDNLEHGLIVDTEFVPGKEPDVCPSAQVARAALSGLGIDDPPVRDLIRDLVARKVAVTSTLPVFETFVPDRPPLGSAAPGSPAAPYMQRVLETMHPDARIEYLTRRARIGETADSPWPALFRKEMDFERALAKAGGLLLAGPDPTGYGAVVAGLGDQRQLELLVEAGFSSVEAVKIATLNGAQYLGELDRIGTLAPGKQADIMIVRGDLGTDISVIENVALVMKDGVGYDPEKLFASARGSVGLR